MSVTTQSSATSSTVTHEWYPEETREIPGMEGMIPREKLINILMTSKFSDIANLDLISRVIPLIDIVGFSHKVKGKTPIPYFGMENAIVSVNYGDYNRGVRNVTETLKKLIYTDFQFEGKNQHVKISSNKAHVTGVRTIETGKKCISKIMDKIEYARQMLMKIRSYDDKDQLLSLVTRDIDDDYMEEIRDQDQELFNLISFITVNKRSRPDYGKFVNDVLFGTDIISENKIEIMEYNIHIRVFYINMCFNINIFKLNQLANDKGYKVTFFNWYKIESVNIMIIDRDSDDGGKPFKTTFKVNSNGSVNIWASKDSDRAFKLFCLLVPLLAKAYRSPSTQKRVYIRKTPRGCDC